MLETRELGITFNNLVAGALSVQTRFAYGKVWDRLIQCGAQLGFTVFPLDPSHLRLYIALLYQEGYAAATIRSSVSAIAHLHKLYGFEDPTKFFFIQQALKGIDKARRTHDIRQPLTVPLLAKLVDALESLLKDKMSVALYTSMFTLAFFGLLRIGEFTGDGEHNLKVNNIERISRDKCDIIFRSYKHCKRPTRISIVSRPLSTVCPVRSLREYLKFRGWADGPLFIWNGGPVKPQQFRALLKKAILLIGCPLVINAHSFRIGGTTYLGQQGYSNVQIQKMGRWNSPSAFLKYLR